MAASNLGLNTLRCRLSTLSSLCAWLVKREILATNPVVGMDRPPRQAVTPAVPAPALMDALVEAARERGRPRDLAIFLLLRFTGMRRHSVATLRVRHLDPAWGLRDVPVKGGKTQDIPLPAPVNQFLSLFLERVLARECATVTPDTAEGDQIRGHRLLALHQLVLRRVERPLAVWDRRAAVTCADRRRPGQSFDPQEVQT
jgi:site-specific recombinase XerC